MGLLILMFTPPARFPEVKLGLRWGAVLGAVVGWLRALAVVDPAPHPSVEPRRGGGEVVCGGGWR